MAKEMELARTGQGINEMLKSAEREKIRRLKNLQGLAERHIGEIERDMPSALDFDDGSKINPFEVNPTLTDPYGLTGEGDVIKQQYIDTPLLQLTAGSMLFFYLINYNSLQHHRNK